MTKITMSKVEHHQIIRLRYSVASLDCAWSLTLSSFEKGTRYGFIARLARTRQGRFIIWPSQSATTLLEH